MVHSYAKVSFLEVEKVLVAELHSLLYIMIAKSPREVTKDFLVLSTHKVYFNFCALRHN